MLLVVVVAVIAAVLIWRSRRGRAARLGAARVGKALFYSMALAFALVLGGRMLLSALGV